MMRGRIHDDPDLERKMEQWAMSCMNGKRLHKEISSGSAELTSIYDSIDYHTYSFAENWLETNELRDISFLRQQFPWLRLRKVDLVEDPLESLLEEKLQPVLQPSLSAASSSF